MPPTHSSLNHEEHWDHDRRSGLPTTGGNLVDELMGRRMGMKGMMMSDSNDGRRGAHRDRGAAKKSYFMPGSSRRANIRAWKKLDSDINFNDSINEIFKNVTGVDLETGLKDPSSLKKKAAEKITGRKREIPFDVVIEDDNDESTSDGLTDNEWVGRHWLFKESLNHEEDAFVEGIKKKRVFTISEYHTHGKFEIEQNQSTTGEEKLRRFLRLIYYEFKWKPKKFQRKFISFMVQILAPIIVGEEAWVKIGARIRKEFGWSNNPAFCVASAPRRFGKSMAVGMVLAALALTCPGFTMCIFSTGGRASSALRDAMVMVLQTSGFGHHIKNRSTNQEEIHIRCLFTKDGLTTATVKFFPDNPKISVNSIMIVPSPDYTLLSFLLGVIWWCQKWLWWLWWLYRLRVLVNTYTCLLSIQKSSYSYAISDSLLASA